MSDKELMELALSARGHAHAPYSQFAVGAALQVESGQVFIGCNVENVSLGLTMCAEQAAVAAAVSAGERSFTAIAIATDSGEPVMPCGRCRQILEEFNPDIEVIAGTANGRVEKARLSELLPKASQGIRDSLQNVSASK